MEALLGLLALSSVGSFMFFMLRRIIDHDPAAEEFDPKTEFRHWETYYLVSVDEGESPLDTPTRVRGDAETALDEAKCIVARGAAHAVKVCTVYQTVEREDA